MIKIFEDALKITNNNIILATPLIFFLLLISLYKGFVGSINSHYLLVLSFVTYVCMWAAFLSGWFYIVRQAILINYEDISKEEKVKKSFGLISAMLKGIGEYFVSFLGVMGIAFLLFMGILYLVYVIGINFIGNLNISVNELTSVSQAELEAYLKTLPQVELVKIIKWVYLSLVFFIGFMYVTLFWATSILKDTKNIFKAFFISNKFLFKNFISSLVFLIVLCILHFVVMSFCGILTGNPVLAYFSLLIYFYFMVYITVLVFLFYEKLEEKSCSSCGADSIGQDSVCDKSGKED